MAQYGLPYKGSKRRYADELFAYFPKRRNFVDLFCGGCSMTHKALTSRKYERIHANDINVGVPELFKSAIRGDFMEETRWIDRETFQRLKGTDMYVALCWSFGNNGETYMYSQDIEPWKKALHYARVYGDCSLLGEFGIDSDGSRSDINFHHEEYKRKYVEWYIRKYHDNEDIKDMIANIKDRVETKREELRMYLVGALKDSGLTQSEVQRRLGTRMAGHYFGKSQFEFPTREYYDMMRGFMPALDKDYDEIYGLHELLHSLQRLESLHSIQRLHRLESLQSLERLQRLQRLQSIQSIQSLESLQVSGLSYDEFEIPNDSVVYCDIPYIGVNGDTHNSNYNDGNGGMTTFDHERFYDWCARQKELVFVSSYSMPLDRFRLVHCINSVTSMGHSGRKTTEGLYVPIHQAHLIDHPIQLSLW